ncbi:metallopeptidase family protein [Frondihabitans sp. PhB188]|uniref:metallopeptidase family protein n=1 Tax=Frondihabitans sp. PhB188 TaxID=2485200 RepID=UPI000F49D78C|nr:metallopeptidase family protein [Frondihabitans sp. PhB188]
MARSRSVRVTGRSTFRDRHGRGLRSSAAGPHLPFLQTRIDLFDDIVGAAAQYLRELWPDDLADVTFEVAGLPGEGSDGLVRYRVDARRRSIVLYRLPIERLAKPREPRGTQDAAWDHRMTIEGYVFRAVGELIGRDPWDLAPDRYRDR